MIIEAPLKTPVTLDPSLPCNTVHAVNFRGELVLENATSGPGRLEAVSYTHLTLPTNREV